MNTRQRSVSKASVLDKAMRPTTYINSPSILRIPRSSILFRTDRDRFKIPKYQNTYRLEAHRPFKPEAVDTILSNVMREYLVGLKYHPQVCMQMCERISEEVRDKICRKFYDRYKIVVMISIIQKLGQSIRMDFGKLWDVERDTYSTYVVETAEFIAMGLVVGTYYE